MSSQAMRIEPPDATYRSLAALLSSPAASAASHLALIGPASLSTSITHYLATLPTDDASKFAQLLTTSKAIWTSAATGTVAIDAAEPSAPPSTPSGTREVANLLSRVQLLFEATARAVLARIQVVVYRSKGNLGWSAQRALVSWIRAISDAVHIDADSTPAVCKAVPVPPLAIQTGLVAGLQAARAQSKAEGSKNGSNVQSNALSTRYALRRAEEEWCTTLAECMAILADMSVQKDTAEEENDGDEWEKEFRKATLSAGLEATGRSDPQNDPRTVTLFLAAQVSPYVSVKRLAILPPEDLIAVLSDTLLGLFENCGVFQSLREDVKQDSEGRLILETSSPTSQRANAFANHPLFIQFGPLSRLLSLAFSGVTRTLSPVQVQHSLLDNQSGQTTAPVSRMQAIAAVWQARWFSCRLAGAKEDEIAEPSREQTKLLWTIFKTLLFSYTMIFDALLEAIVDVCPSPTETRPIDATAQAEQTTRWPATTQSNIPPAYLAAVRSVLLTYSHLSWVTATFGSAAFDAYRRVFYEALEVLARDGRASVALAEELMPTSLGTLRINAAIRAESTFFLDVVEQLMIQLPNDMVEQAILPACRPYLDNRVHQEAFESAHSVVLSIYATGKECLLELTPYYTQLLLASFPSSLTADQLAFAFSTVMDAVSDRSDTLAWHTLEVLWREIEKERFLAKGGLASSVGHTAVPSPGPEQEDGLTQRESDLSNVFVAQVPNVNLVLLRATLSRVKRLIMHRERGSEGRLRLLERTFASLAGLDASTREEGVRWWLEERERFGV